jgi:uncharacterized protein (DUF433 family)
MSSVIKIDPEIMSGAPCFAATRVRIQNLIDYLEGGDSIEDLGFPTVSREQVIAFSKKRKIACSLTEPMQRFNGSTLNEAKPRHSPARSLFLPLQRFNDSTLHAARIVNASDFRT